MKSNNNTLEIPLKFGSRKLLLRANAELIAQLQERLKAKRFRPQEGDSLKLAYTRVYLSALQAQNAMLKDLELDEMKRRLEALENSQKEKSGAAQACTPAFRGLNVDSCSTP